MSVLNTKYMQDEVAAFAHIEGMLWPDGPVCPHCGVVDNAYSLNGVRSKPSKKNPDGKVRHSLKKCKDCGKQFTVRMRTIFESSHIDLHLWLQAIHLVTSSKKGISANQLHRTLGVTLKTAWFLGHRIREAMRDNSTATFGKDGGIVESDETFIGIARERRPGARGYSHKNKVLSLVDRDSKQARSMVVDSLQADEIMPILKENISKDARLMTDEAKHYSKAGKHFSDHGTVEHGAGEYVSALDRSIHTNTIEGYFSIFKRGMKGIYQHCSKKHLHRYLAEYEFRYNNREANGIEDAERAANALMGVVGKRLSYQTAG